MASPRKDEFMMPQLDLRSPRIKAAMKVTGIQPGDVAESMSGEADSSSPRDRRRSLMERKRRQLILELDDTAKALDEEMVDELLSPGSDALEAEARHSLEFEKRKIDERRERVKTEIQRELEREMDRKKAFDDTRQGRRDFQARMKEKTDEKMAVLTGRMDEARRRCGKQEETLTKSRKEDWNKRKDLMKKINEKNDKIDKQAEARVQAWAETSEERRRKIEETVQKSMEIQKVEEEDKIRKFEAALSKQREREERMQRSAQEALQQKRSKFADKMSVVNQCMQDRQNEREKKFKESCVKLEEARKAARERQLEVIEKTRTAREKEMSKWQNNRDGQRKETREKMTKLKNELSNAHSKSLEVQKQYLEDTVYKKADMNQMMLELVEQNKARIARAEDCTREQTLAKIRHTKDKMNAHAKQQKQVESYRIDALRDEMIGRTQLNELKKVMQDSSAKRINQLLKEMDLPLLPTEKQQVEAEEEKKQ